jgi:hypothetical protein
VKALPISPGDVYGRWTVISLDGNSPRGKWLCRCECGSEGKIEARFLQNGHSKSCGCHGREARIIANTKHGSAQRGKKTRAYTIWVGMNKRCYSPNEPSYPHYGGRGITICEAWRTDFSAFLRDMGEPPPGHSIERDDVDGNYEPKNCRWATCAEQSNNARSNVMIATPDGAVTMAEFARLHGLDYKKFKERVRAGATDMSGVKFEILGKRGSIEKEAA